MFKRTNQVQAHSAYLAGMNHLHILTLWGWAKVMNEFSRIKLPKCSSEVPAPPPSTHHEYFVRANKPPH